ncbi:MAG: hypothetical protein AB7F35_01045 [Acetobacteraceae bacterium]
MKAVIVIRGGCLATVYSDDPDLKIELIDHDDLSSVVHQSDADEVSAAEGLHEVY